MVNADELLSQSIAQARKRLLPFLLLMYVVSVLDRTNVAFAKQALQSSKGVSEAAYALGAGLFFLTYALFEVPSNLLMYQVGARIWLSRIMVVWGLISAATMFVAGDKSFYCLRLLLGAAEAGFFSGVILYLTYWFPNRARGQVLGLFYFGAPLSFIVGSPLSGFLMGMRPVLGLQGWQWMFLIEGFFAVAVGVAVFLFLRDGPATAPWLSDAEKHQLLKTLSSEEAERRARGLSSPAELLRSPHMLYFSATYFLIQAGVYGVIFYLPTEVASILGQTARTGSGIGISDSVDLCDHRDVLALPRCRSIQQPSSSRQSRTRRVGLRHFGSAGQRSGHCTDRSLCGGIRIYCSSTALLDVPDGVFVRRKRRRWNRNDQLLWQHRRLRSAQHQGGC